MTSEREEMLERQLAERDETVRRYAQLVGSIKEWADIGEAGFRHVPPLTRLSQIRRLLKEHRAERTIEADGP